MSAMPEPASDATNEPLELFWHSLARDRDGERPPSEVAAARRIVTTYRKDLDAVRYAAAFAREFAVALPRLAEELEHPTEETLQLIRQPPAGAALIATIAIRHGQLRQDDSDLPGAERYFRWALPLFRALGERQAESLSLTLLGRVVEMQDHLHEAAQCYQAALDIDHAVADHANEAVDLGLLGQIAWQRGKLDAAERYAYQAINISRRQGDRRNATSTLLTLSEIERARGHHWRAALSHPQ